MNVADFLKKAAERNGFVRDRFEERRLPTDSDNLTIFPFFGDYRAMSLLSSWFLHNYKQTHKSSKYLILASWPGFQSLFPQADEYWSFNDTSQLKRFFEQVDGFRNRSDLFTIYLRNLNEYFRDVVDWRQVVEPYYQNGLTQNFWDTYKKMSVFLPNVPSAGILGKDFVKDLATKPGYKVFIQPSLFAQSWRLGKNVQLPIKKEFWLELTKYLLNQNITPVLWQNCFSHDLSPELLEQCLYLSTNDITKVLATMRTCHCTLDIFNNLSRLAVTARSPFLVLDERSRYSALKEFEVNDLNAKFLPKEYIFTFSTIISDGAAWSWKSEVFPSIVNKINSFIPSFNRDALPSTAEFHDIVLYETVRKNKNKKFGTRLLKVNRD
jgi:hypothetical protein